MSFEQGKKKTDRIFKNWKFGLDHTKETKSDVGEQSAEETNRKQGKPQFCMNTCGFLWNQTSCKEYKCENDLSFENKNWTRFVATEANLSQAN